MRAAKSAAAADWCARVTALVRGVSRRIAQGIQKSPYASLGAAAGVGILLGASVRAGPGRAAALAVATGLIRGGLAPRT